MRRRVERALFRYIQAIAALMIFAGVTLAAAAVSGPAARSKKVAKAGGGDGASVKLAAIAPVVRKAIAEGKCPGAVVLIGNSGRVVYRHAFGERSLTPRRTPMRPTTIFDIASLTKVIATTTAVMQLFEQGKLRLNDPVAKYWPEFGANGKDVITIRELMTHYSGLPPDLPLEPAWSGYNTALKLIVNTQPIEPPGTRFIYSDINYETMGELVRRVSGESLNDYCAKHIFKPLHMTHTRFLPPRSWRENIAPTQYQHGATGKMLWGEVHDPTAYNMGGVAGHAGLFSNADDLAIFCQMILNGGSAKGVRILSAASVAKMTTPQTPPNAMAVRGLGWDIETAFSSNRGELFPVGSFGHSGFTGTSIWIDPFSKTYVVLLTNAVHPVGKGDVIGLRAQVANIAAAVYGRIPSADELASRASSTGFYDLLYGFRTPPLRNDAVRTGIDVLEAEGFAPLRGKRVGLVTNHSGLDSAGRRTIDLLFHAPGVRLTAIFSPEHGLYGKADEPVDSTTEPATGLPVYSLFGKTYRPTPQMMAGLDAVVYDIQDAGVRYYTYVTTLGYMMEAAAQRHIPIYVLDRPNPINGYSVEGPVLDADLKSFVAYFALPVRHGMTLGELATMFNHENYIGADLHVIKMQGWHRTDWLDETGVAWIDPSPNLRTLTEEALYPGVGMIEGANLSVGRGTDTPFEWVGAPWIDAKKLSAYLNARKIQGVRFLPVDFTPRSSRFKGETCHGVSLALLDRQALNSPELGVELASALYHLFPGQFQLAKTVPLVGSRQVIESIQQGRDPRAIALHWEERLQAFRNLRGKYLLYE
jgi:uncharacterized protein YbbC (DUF1343 family)/CubicO group peptidase (beta-lactamase class C family)